MTKVGVITMHRVPNYGSLLQAYATQKIVERLGCDCEIIDYVYPNEFQFSRGYAHSPMTLRKRIFKMLWFRPHWRKRNRLERFAKRHLKLSPTYINHEALEETAPKYDVYMTGSDQVWNPHHMRGDGTFLLDFVPDNIRKIAFSSSFACRDLPEEHTSRYAQLLSRYRDISVREENSQKLVEQLTGKDVPITLDPTLMLNADEWRALSHGKRNKYQGRKYIVLYMLKYAFEPRPYIYQLVRHLQQQTGYTICSFTKIPREFGCRDVLCVEDISPIEFLQLFDGASHVVTSSFHGTAFAVNFGVPLYSLIDDSGDEKDDRQRSLLESLQLSSCLVRKNTPLNDVPLNPMITPFSRSLLEDMRVESMSYLSKAIIPQ